MAYDQPIASMTVFMEASHEPAEGLLGVAYVIANRWRNGRWGSTIAAVCFQPHQFSCWSYTGPNMERVARTDDTDPILAAASDAVSNAIHKTAADPTNGALYYFADYIPKPTWADKLTFTVKIGHHEFFK